LLTPGTVIDGRYRVDEEIGSGGFATVFSGQHLALDARVAIKVLRLYAEDSPTRREALLRGFMDEARLVVRLRHDNIVRTLDQGVYAPGGSDFGLPYVVFEWCGDSSMARFLASRNGAPLPVAEAYPLIEAITSAMAHAHELGIAHRDLKPANVMVKHDARGQLVPRVIDFGIAKLFETDRTAGETKTLTAGAKYTLAYAAPEQLSGIASGPWTDVHAIGLIFVELTTGRPPYESCDLGPIDPNRPTPKRFGVDVGAFEAVILRAVAFDPRDRFRNAGELLSALRAANQEVISSEAVTAIAPRLRQVAQPVTEGALANTVTERPRSKRWPLLLAFGAVAVIACAVVVVMALSKNPERRLLRSAHLASALPALSAHLSEMTRSELERRLIAAGAAITGRGEEPTQQYLYFSGNGMSGTAYLNQVSIGGNLTRSDRELATLPTIKSWIAFDRAQGLELAYGVDGDRVLSLTGTSKGPTLALFEKLAKGFALRLRGSSFGRPDPATYADDAKSLWHAKSLADLGLAELMSRVTTAGATIVGIRLAPRVWSLTLQEDQNKGELDVFHSAASADELVAALQKSHARFVTAGSGGARAVCQGTGSLSSKAFSKRVFEGLGLSFE
jgi:serine/threonine protein kinase